MEPKDLKQMKLDEKRIELAFYDVGDEFDDSVGYSLEGLRKLVEQNEIKNKDIPRMNQYIEQRYSINNSGRVVFFPFFSPTNQINVMIIDYVKIFGTGALVLCNHEGNKFVYFDPEADNVDYDSLLSQTKKINLGAISSGGVYVPEKDDYLDFKNSSYISTSNFPLYSSIFDVNKLIERRNNDVLLDVKNPLAKDLTLELIANFSQIEEPVPSKIRSDYYFIGSISSE